MSSDVICLPLSHGMLAFCGCLTWLATSTTSHDCPMHGAWLETWLCVNPKMAGTWMLMPKIWYPLVNVYITNWKDPPCSMGKSSISMVIFNSKLLVITRGYIPIISHYINHYKNPIKSPCFMVFDPSPISLKRRMWVDFLHISTSHALVHWGSFGHASFFWLKIR